MSFEDNKQPFHKTMKIIPLTLYSLLLFNFFYSLSYYIYIMEYLRTKEIKKMEVTIRSFFWCIR